MTPAEIRELLDAGQNNAKVQYLLGGGNAEAALVACEGSHTLPELSEGRALYVGAYMDTIWRLRKSSEAFTASQQQGHRETAADRAAQQATVMCGNCMGKGMVDRKQGFFTTTITCTVCRGTGCK